MLLIAGKLLAVYLMYDGSLRSFAIALFIGELLSAPAYVYVNKSLLRVGLRPWTADVAKTLLSVSLAGAALALLLHQVLDTAAIMVRLLVSFPCIMVLSALCFVAVRLPIAAELRKALQAIPRNRSR